MVILEHIPNGIEEIISYYGDPKEAGWFDKNMTICRLPFSLRQSWNEVRIDRFHVHKLVANAMLDALLEIEAYAGMVFLRQHDLDMYGGVYNDRNKRGSSVPSIHSFGAAMDYCPLLGPFREPSRMPYFIVRAFTKRGFVNLKLDGQHNQACSSY